MESERIQVRCLRKRIFVKAMNNRYINSASSGMILRSCRFVFLELGHANNSFCFDEV